MKYADEQSAWEAQRDGRLRVAITLTPSHWRRFMDWLRGRKPYVRKFEAPNPERRKP